MPGHPSEPTDHPLLRKLNAPQREAVRHAHGPLLILAGAGSGKTTVITRRIAWLIEEEGVHPGSILAMTFTNKAAEEMRERVQRLVSVPAAQMWVSTFHSFCTRILRREGEHTPVGRDFVIFDPADQKSLIKQVLAELKLPEKQFHPKKVLELISDFKNRCLLPVEAREEALDPWTRKVLDAYDLYQKGLKNHRACDFDDLLLWTERLFRDPVLQAVYGERFRYILVDEYQDTNRAQYLLVQHLARRHHNLCVVGDEDQSIYGWRGADIRNILDFQRDFPEAVRIELMQNYRSTKKILDAASEVIANNAQRMEGKGALITDLGDGESIVFKLSDEGRLEAVRAAVAARGVKVTAYIADGFDRMLAERKPETVIVTTKDSTHDHYIVKALDAGADVIAEKPLTIDEARLQRIVDAIAPLVARRRALQAAGAAR